MTGAKWRSGYGFYSHVDANKVADEILSIGESATAQQIVDRARDKNSELHKCFEWDDTVAAEKYRLKQAGYVVHHLVIPEPEQPTDRPEIRFFAMPKQGEGYKPTRMIVKREQEYKDLLARAWAELRAFKQKYACLEELREILDMID